MNVELKMLADLLKQAGVLERVAPEKFYQEDPRICTFWCPDGHRSKDKLDQQEAYCAARSNGEHVLHTPSLAGGILRLLNLPTDKPRFHGREIVLGEIEIALEAKKVQAFIGYLHLPCAFARDLCGLTPLQTIALIPEAKEIVRQNFPELSVHIYMHLGFEARGGRTYAFRREPWLKWAAKNQRLIDAPWPDPVLDPKGPDIEAAIQGILPVLPSHDTSDEPLALAR